MAPRAGATSSSASTFKIYSRSSISRPSQVTDSTSGADKFPSPGSTSGTSPCSSSGPRPVLPKPCRVPSTPTVSPGSAPAQLSPLVATPALASRPPQTGAGDNGSRTDNDDALVENDNSLDRADPPAPTNPLSRPPATSTDAPTLSSREDEEIDELDPPTDAALPGASNRLGASQTSAPVQPASKPRKVTGKYVIFMFSHLLSTDTVQGAMLRRVGKEEP